MANKRESAFSWEKTETGTQMNNSAFSNKNEKQREQTKHFLLCDKAQNGVI